MTDELREQDKYDDRPVGERDKRERAKHWLNEIKLADKHADTWSKQAKEIIKRFRATERDLGADEKPKSARIDWSNAQTMKAALYSGAPHPIIKRRTDSKDAQARLSAQIWEDVTAYSLEEDQEIDDVYGRAIFDYLQIARGVVRERYNPTFEEVTEPVEAIYDQETQIWSTSTGDEIEQDDLPAIYQDQDGSLKIEHTYEKLVKAESVTEYVHYSDFLTNPARVPSEIRWMAYRSYLTLDELKERFDNKIAIKIKRDKKPAGLDDIVEEETEQGPYKKAEIWEVWDKDTKKVYWVSPGYTEGVLDEADDPYGLKRFFPSPFPCSALASNDSIYPTPSAVYTKDQLTEIDDITGRIGNILDSIRNVGVADQTIIDKINEMMETDNELVGVPGWERFQQEGGLSKSVEWYDFSNAIKAVQVLYQARAEAKALYDEISGFSDIIRGETNPNETATAQQMKGQFAQMRFNDWRREVNRFLRDAVRIKAEIVAEHFPPEILYGAANVEHYAEDVDQQKFMAAVELLRNEDIRCYRIDIETDQTYLEDSQEEKANRNEFLQVVSEFIPRSLEMTKAFPEFAPVFSELLLFTARTYRPGRAFEDMIEQAVQAMQKAQQEAMNQPAPPDPEQIRMEQEAQVAQGRMQLAQAEMQQKGAYEQAKLQTEAQKNAQEGELKAAELEIKKVELQLKELQITTQQQQIAEDARRKDAELRLKGLEIELKYSAQVPPEVVEPRPTVKQMIPERDEAGNIVSATIREVVDEILR
jgi:hypothetical protein